MNKGTITVHQNEKKEVVIDGIVSYTPPKEMKMVADIARMQIKGYSYSHKKDIDGQECYIFEKI